MTVSVPRRQVLHACAAATLLAAVREPVMAGMRAERRVFFFDPRHASSQTLAASLHPQWGAARAVGDALLSGESAARVLPPGTRLMAGRTTYADFTWLAGLASERRLRPRFHAYHTWAAAGTVERRVLIEEGVRASRLQRLTVADCDRWLQERVPGCAQPRLEDVKREGVRTEADRAGCTLHDWIFHSV